MLAPALPQVGLSVAQASKLIGVSRFRGYALIRQGKLRAFEDIGGMIKVPVEEVHRFWREEEV